MSNKGGRPRADTDREIIRRLEYVWDSLPINSMPVARITPFVAENKAAFLKRAGEHYKARQAALRALDRNHRQSTKEGEETMPIPPFDIQRQLAAWTDIECRAFIVFLFRRFCFNATDLESFARERRLGRAGIDTGSDK